LWKVQEQPSAFLTRTPIIFDKAHWRTGVAYWHTGAAYRQAVAELVEATSFVECPFDRLRDRASTGFTSGEALWQATSRDAGASASAINTAAP
jgi:hypothetical protein